MRRRSTARSWIPIWLLVVVIVAAVVGVWALVVAHEPTAGRPDDVAIYGPIRRDVMRDVLSGELAREAGCTYLDAEDGRRWVVLFADIGIRWEDDWLHVGYDGYQLGHGIDVMGRIVKLPTSRYETAVPDACVGELFFLVR